MKIKEIEKMLCSKQDAVIINNTVGSLGLLGVALVVLKGLGYINISWYVALLPFWGPIVLAFLLILISSAIIIFNTNQWKK